MPEWKRDADFLFAQVRFTLDDLLEWRERVEFDGPVYAGVMVVPSVAMARKISADIPQLAVPDDWLRAIERDPNAGVELACDLVEAIRGSGAFDGRAPDPGESLSRGRRPGSRRAVFHADADRADVHRCDDVMSGRVPSAP